MSYQAPFPPLLERVEYMKIYFHLEIRDLFDLPPFGLLQLRRELLQALAVLQTSAPEQEQVLRRVLLPERTSDPVRFSRVQQPSPALVLTPDTRRQGLIEAGERVVLPVLLLGSGITVLEAFTVLLEEVGRQGLYHGNGRFIVEGIESEDASGVRAMLRQKGEPESALTPPISDLAWWLERQPPLEDAVRLEMLTPLRLVRNGKPLFRASFGDLFPFILRRVIGMLGHHAAVDVVKDPAAMIALADKVSVHENRLSWQDDRSLQQPGSEQKLGGLRGSLALAGEALGELLWVLRIGSLLNVGKGAPYGAGQYRLDKC